MRSNYARDEAIFDKKVEKLKYMFTLSLKTESDFQFTVNWIN